MGADCIDLTFQLSGTGTLADPKWNIRITQYESGFDNLAPFGCTQYYYKRDSDSDGKGTITSYNYNSGGSMHLADQNQVICIRREDDQTRICYWTLLATDLAISGSILFSLCSYLKKYVGKSQIREQIRPCSRPLCTYCGISSL